jgi:xanthine dehydrogenase accessory factor
VESRERADNEPDAARLGLTIATLDMLDDVLKAPDGGPDDRAVVVASQGHYDEEALAAALERGIAYVGLVASRTRGATVKSLLEEQGVPNVGSLRNPAGLDLGARSAGEVALSVLAEIVQAAAVRGRLETVAADVAAPALAVDPVCHMEVEIATARHKADVQGVTYYFCCAGCKSRFLKQPDEYVSRAS